ncbi:pBA71-U104L [African swine fever virus]|uniref:PBA71-U104L n=1 Tax=African swine fever virus TaxID=10497 RepID=A0A0N7CTS6_ASF|nr:pBA71-U104L [African swine fever virus]AKO62691.1 pBA71-U104L [African swine fever virus]
MRFFSYLGLLLAGLTSLQGFSTDNLLEEELRYWCQYVKNCRFCWTCQDGLCKNKVLKDMSSVQEHSYPMEHCMIHRQYKYIRDGPIFQVECTMQTSDATHLINA